MSISTPLSDFRDNEKQWVQYKGQREGAFGVTGDYTNIHYTINGPGHKFEVHVNDLPKFRRSGRGQDFAVGVASPVEAAPVLVEIPPPPENGRYQPPEPVLAQIEQLDVVAARSRGVTLAPPPQNNQPQEPALPQQTYDLSPLDLGEKVQEMLEAESWTIEKLAGADLEELRAYPGIGPKIAGQITQKAKEYLT